MATKKRPIKKRSAGNVRTKRSPKKKVTPKPKSIIDTSDWRSRDKTEFFELRCSKNFRKIVEALQKVQLKPHTFFANNTKSEVVIQAVRDLAKKHSLVNSENEHWI